MKKLKKPANKIWILILLLVVMVGIIFWLWENQDLFKRAEVLSVDDPELIKAIQSNRTKLLIIGLDGASWQVIIDLLGKNQLPTFRRLIEQGSRGIMHSEEPMISPALWTTFATGVSRSKHRIDNFVFKPVRSYETEKMDSRVREAPALWEILSHYGKKVAVVNWNSASPAEPVRGVFIAEGASPDNLNPENVYPSEWIPILQALPLIQVSWFEERLRQWNDPLLKNAYEEDRFVISAGAEILKREQPELMMIYLRNIDVVSHLYWKYRYPFGLDYQFMVSGPRSDLLREVIDSYYQLTDHLLADLVEAATGYNFLILSDHGMSAIYPPRNMYLFTNLLLHQLGELEYQQPTCEDQLKEMTHKGLYFSSAPQTSWFYDCRALKEMVRQNRGPEALSLFLQKRGRIKGADEECQKEIEALYQILTHLSQGTAIDWSRTRLFGIQDSHKIEQGIYINLKNREPQGVVEFDNFQKFRRDTIRRLSALQSAQGKKFFKSVKANPAKREPGVSAVIDPPDILVELNREILSEKLIYRGPEDSEPFFILNAIWLYESGSADHHPEGIIIFSGPALNQQLKISSDIYGITPTILWMFDLPQARDMPGKIINQPFNYSDKPVKYIKSYQRVVEIPVRYRAKAISKEEQVRLKAVGYLK